VKPVCMGTKCVDRTTPQTARGDSEADVRESRLILRSEVLPVRGRGWRLCPSSSHEHTGIIAWVNDNSVRITALGRVGKRTVVSSGQG
jgi:hypothetical protein